MAFDVTGVTATTLDLEADANGSVGAVAVVGGNLQLDGVDVPGVDLLTLTTINIDANGFSNTKFTLDNNAGGLAGLLGLDVSYEGGAGLNNSLTVKGDAALDDSFVLDLEGGNESQLSVTTSGFGSLDVDINNLTGRLTLDGGASAGDTLAVNGSVGDDKLGIGVSVAGGTSVFVKGVEDIDVDLSSDGVDEVSVRTSLGVDVSIDITGGGAGIDILNVYTTAGDIDQDVSIDLDSVDVEGEGSISYSLISTINLDTSGGNDTVTADVAAAAALDVNIEAGAGIDLVMVNGTALDDTITIDGDVVVAGGATIESHLAEIIGVNGLDGDDTLTGSVGANVLIGGKGDDEIHAGGGADLVIGGDDVDDLFGDAGGDLMIGAATQIDAQARALLSVMQEWTSSNSLKVKLKHLTKGDKHGAALNGTVLLNAKTIVDDGSADTLEGSAGADIFFAAKSDTIVDFTNKVDAKVKLKAKKA